MFLICSYFSNNLSLNVLIKFVLIITCYNMYIYIYIYIYIIKYSNRCIINDVSVVKIINSNNRLRYIYMNDMLMLSM